MIDIQETNTFSYDFEPIRINDDMSNKLFCTFSTEQNLDSTLTQIQDNVDFGNISNFLENTILVHRKKESNTLYTINALNTLIKELNGGVADNTFRVNWPDFKNCILLTKGDELKRINTKLYKILEL